MASDQDQGVIAAWLRRLDPEDSLGPQARTALQRLTSDRRPFVAQQPLTHQGDTANLAILVLEGFLARAKETAGGRRQIISILLPGDFCAAGLALVAPLDAQLVALSAGLAAWISAAQLLDLQATCPEVMLPLARSLAEENAITREWVVNVGARSGEARLAHLLCELMWRLRAVGLAEDGSCDLPLRQQDLAEAVGMTPVHINRVLQRLRKSGLIALRGGLLQVLEGERLAGIGDFDPAYLEARGTSAEALAWRMIEFTGRNTPLRRD